jgi:hypothetical protein
VFVARRLRPSLARLGGRLAKDATPCLADDHYAAEVPRRQAQRLSSGAQPAQNELARPLMAGRHGRRRRRRVGLRPAPDGCSAKST